MSRLRWRRFSPIDRDLPIFELVDSGLIILDVTKDDAGNLAIAFHDGAVGQALDLRMFERLITEVRALFAQEDGGEQGA